MCFDFRYLLLFVILMTSACTSYLRVRQMRSGDVAMGLSVREDSRWEEQDEPQITDTVVASVSDGPILMNAIRDSETGEMVATDVISASRVTARFRNVPERDGYVTIGFDITVPAEMMDSRWQLKVRPAMRIQDDTIRLQPVYMTGKGYRQEQLRGYQRYRAFLASIITDTTDLVRMGQLEIFLQRNFPETYRMKSDSSIVTQPMAESLFGVTQMEALRHYTRDWRVRRNEWKKRNKGDVFRRYVKDSIVREGLKLDTVITRSGDFIYQYNHTFRSRPGLKKVVVSISGELYEHGKCILALPFPDDLTFYVSSLSSLADTSVRYMMIVLERRVDDHTKALIDFESASARVDTSRGDNASELRRVLRCIGDVVSRDDLVLDSLVVAASCSPEGKYGYNEKLSAARSAAVMDMLGRSVTPELKPLMKASSVPENWSQLRLLVQNDTIMSSAGKRRMLMLMEDLSQPDVVEKKLSHMSEYRYLREKLYPQLRSVSFDFYLHRKGMVKDTVHTTRVDTVYMSGVEALSRLDYKRAVEVLRPYSDYNTALAYVSSGYNHSALQVLEGLDDNDSRVCYLLAMVLSRLGNEKRALKYFERALELAPALEFRANLDPEMSELVRRKLK
jgi:tetratricopeptide (TPR) repeat protein